MLIEITCRNISEDLCHRDIEEKLICGDKTSEEKESA